LVPAVRLAKLDPKEIPDIVLLESIVFVTTPVPPLFINTPATFGSMDVADVATGFACKTLVPLTDPAKVIWLIPAKDVLVAPKAIFVLPIVNELFVNELLGIAVTLDPAKPVTQVGFE
jgi:hypothetical protein